MLAPATSYALRVRRLFCSFRSHSYKTALTLCWKIGKHPTPTTMLSHENKKSEHACSQTGMHAFRTAI